MQVHAAVAAPTRRPPGSGLAPPPKAVNVSFFLSTSCIGSERRLILSGCCASKHPSSLRLPPCYRPSAARPGARAPQWRSGRQSPSAREGGGAGDFDSGGGSRPGKTTPPWSGVELRPGPPGPRTLQRSASGRRRMARRYGSGCCGSAETGENRLHRAPPPPPLPHSGARASRRFERQMASERHRSNPLSSAHPTLYPHLPPPAALATSLQTPDHWQQSPATSMETD